jgi:hypothetical protein
VLGLVPWAIISKPLEAVQGPWREEKLKVQVEDKKGEMEIIGMTFIQLMKIVMSPIRHLLLAMVITGASSWPCFS